MGKKTTSGNPQIAGNKRRITTTSSKSTTSRTGPAGWEVKSLRAGRAHLKESYVLLRDGEAFSVRLPHLAADLRLHHVQADPTRTRKLLLHKEQISRLIGSVERKGYTLIPLAMYWKRNRAKLDIGLARGKKEHDKRASEQDRDWEA